MAKPPDRPCVSMRVPKGVLQELQRLAGEHEWALNTEVEAALQHWCLLPDTVREAAARATREALTEGRSVMRIPPKPDSRLELIERVRELSGEVQALRQAVAKA